METNRPLEPNQEETKSNVGSMTYYAVDRNGSVATRNMEDPLPMIVEGNKLERARVKYKYFSALVEHAFKTKKISATQREDRLQELALEKSQVKGPSVEVVKDYTAEQRATQSGVTELWNEDYRDAQEDRVVCNPLPFEMKPEVIQKVSEATTDELHRLIASQPFGTYAGATMSATFRQGNTVVHSNLGDSVAFAFFVDKEKGTCRAVQLNEKTFHRPDVPSEQERIETTGAKVQHGKAGPTIRTPTEFSLGVSRTLGDTNFDPFGVSHQVESTMHQLSPNPGEEIVIVNACDGLTDKLSMKDLESIMLAHADQSPQAISLALAQAAKKAGSTDNISVVVSKGDGYSVVLDGHGGDEVSDFAHELYHEIFTNQLLLQKIAENDLEMAERISGNMFSVTVGQSAQAIKSFYQPINAALAVMVKDQKLSIYESLQRFITMTLLEREETTRLQKMLNHPYLKQLNKTQKSELHQLFQTYLSFKDKHNIIARNALADPEKNEFMRDVRRNFQSYTQGVSKIIEISQILAGIRTQASKLPNLTSNKAAGRIFEAIDDLLIHTIRNFNKDLNLDVVFENIINTLDKQLQSAKLLHEQQNVFIKVMNTSGLFHKAGDLGEIIQQAKKQTEELAKPKATSRFTNTK